MAFRRHGFSRLGWLMMPTCCCCLCCLCVANSRYYRTRAQSSENRNRNYAVYFSATITSDHHHACCCASGVLSEHCTVHKCLNDGYLDDRVLFQSYLDNALHWNLVWIKWCVPSCVRINPESGAIDIHGHYLAWTVLAVRITQISEFTGFYCISSCYGLFCCCKSNWT